MPDQMRIYVGTLYTIEKEFEECVASIKRQTYRNYEHFVFEGLPNKTAHDTLFSDFFSKSGKFDLLVKVDADMVIEDKHLFSGIVDRFRKNLSLHLLQIAVHDWFSNRLIGSMNAYSNTVSWKMSDENLFVDMVDIDQEHVSIDWTDLAPAAIHCKDPSPFQAFHFGVHKGLKILQRGRPSGRREHWRMRSHWENVEYTYLNFKASKDVRLGYAVIGSELALSGLFKSEHLSHSNPFCSDIFSRYQGLDSSCVENEIKRLKSRNWGWLPNRMRKALLWYLYRERYFSIYAIRSLIRDLFFNRPAT